MQREQKCEKALRNRGEEKS